MTTDTSSLQDTTRLRLWHGLSAGLALVGAAFSLYAAIHHRKVVRLGATDALCNLNAKFSCDAIALSDYANFLAVPWGVWGIAFYTAVLLLTCLSFFNPKNRQEHLAGHAVLMGAGLLTSLALIYIAVYWVAAFCIVCLVVHLVNFSQVALCFWAWKSRTINTRFTIKGAFSGITTSVLAVAAVLIANNIIGEKITHHAVRDKQPPQQLETTAQLLSSESVKIPIALSPYSGGGEDYRRGADNAPVTLVVFSDFQCPSCRQLAKYLDTLLERFDGKLRVVFRNYPLDHKCNSAVTRPMHIYACQCAVMARCAGRYGLFWRFHDHAFRNQGSMSSGVMRVWAKAIGLSDEQISSCARDETILEKVKSDIALGDRLFIDATPTIFVNGRKFEAGWDSLELTIRQELGQM